MEHLSNDLSVISRIPKDKKIILSVPSFDDPTHVRFFTNSEEIRKYYPSVREITRIDRHFVVEI